MRCFFEESRLRIVTKGGSELVNNVRHRVLDVFPLDDGLIIKAAFNADLYTFELGGGAGMLGKQGRESYVYLTLLTHPLNDARPLAFE
jgi:hypothetical protein